MKIIQNVTVKQILTEESKQQLFQKYYFDKQQLKKEIEQLRFELKRLGRSKDLSKESLIYKFEKETNFRQEKIKLLQFQIDQLENLPLASEFEIDSCQALVEIEVGDEWNDEITNKTIIVKDGVISEIR